MHPSQTAFQKNASAALNFWEMIALEEADREGRDEPHHKFIAENGAAVINMLLSIMASPIANVEDEEDDFGPLDAAHNTFLEVTRAVGAVKSMELVMPWVQAALSSPEWQKREAATMALGLLQQVATSAEAMPLNTMALPVLWPKLLAAEAGAREANPKAREALAYFMTQVYRNHAVALLETGDKVKEAVANLCRLLHDPLPGVAKLAATGINFVFQEFKDQHDDGHPGALYVRTAEGEATLFSGRGGAFEILQALVARGVAAAGEDEYELSAECFSAVNQVISTFCVADVGTAAALLKDVGMARLAASVAKTANPLSAAERAVEKEYQSRFCGMVHELLMLAEDFERSEPPELSLTAALKPLAQDLCALLLSVVDRNLVSSEPWFALTHIVGSSLLPVEFWLQPAVMQTVHPRIMKGLSSIAEGDSERVTAALLAAGDVMRRLAERTPPDIAKEYTNAALIILQNSEVDRALKPTALGLLQDSALCLEAVKPLMDNCFQTICNASQVADAVRWGWQQGGAES